MKGRVWWCLWERIVFSVSRLFMFKTAYALWCNKIEPLDQACFLGCMCAWPVYYILTLTDSFIKCHQFGSNTQLESYFCFQYFRYVGQKDLSNILELEASLVVERMWVLELWNPKMESSYASCLQSWQHASQSTPASPLIRSNTHLIGL